MAHRYLVCFHCHGVGHKKEFCPLIQCFRCSKFGHIADRCPLRSQAFGKKGGWGGQTQKAPLSKKDPPGQAAGPDTRKGEKKRTRKEPRPSSSPVSADALASALRSLPELGTRSWLGCGRISTSSTRRSSSAQSDSDPQSPGLPTMVKELRSDVRCTESVKRVAEAIYLMKGEDEDPIQIFTNKQFEDFHEDRNPGLLFIPKTFEIQKGDFDIICLHPAGYFHLEVKAFGDVQDHLDPERKMNELMIVLLKKAVPRLQKGRRVLQVLQPPGQTVSIVNTLALPNVTRDFLRSTLQRHPDLRQTLAACMAPSKANVALENLCLCSDDLLPKDGVLDETDPAIKKAIDTWWSHITAAVETSRPISKENYTCILRSFFNNEDVKSFDEYVQDTGGKFQTPRLDEQQMKSVKNPEQYVYVSGPHGCGKSLVLAEKSATWLREGYHVVLLYAYKIITNQPAAEVLSSFIQRAAGSDWTSDMSSRLLKVDISSFNPTEVVADILETKNNPGQQKVPRSPIRRPADVMFEELVVSEDKIKEIFNEQALTGIPMKKDNPASDQGEDMCIVMDEFQMRTMSEVSTQLLEAIKKRFPAAKIWCAGLFQTHRPASFFHEELFYPYRCTPKTQRLLQALEPFCQNEQQPVFKYLTSSTCMPPRGRGSDPEKQYQLPRDGPDPVFRSHAPHGLGEITDCSLCAQTLVHLLKDELKIGQKNCQGKQLEESDVLIVVSSTALYNNMRALVNTELYRHLTNYFTLYIHKPSDAIQLDKPGICIMHARVAGGMEKKTVVSIPCKQFQARQLTYAEVVRRQVAPETSKLAHGRRQGVPGQDRQGQSTKHYTQGSEVPQHQSLSTQSSTLPTGQGQNLPPANPRASPATPPQADPGPQQAAGDSAAGPQTPHPVQGESCPAVAGTENDNQRRIRDILQSCHTLTQRQRDSLAGLGMLNLHWLWYSISRSLSLNVIFHF